MLPKEIIYRKKTGFGAPINRWIKKDLSEILNDTLSEDRLKSRGIFDAKATRKLLDMNANDKINANYTLFSILCTEIWSQTFLD